MAGSEMLEQEAKRIEELGGGLYFYHIKDSVFKHLLRSDAFEHIGDHHFFPAKKSAIQWVFTQLDEDQCRSCPKRIFQECHTVDRDEETNTDSRSKV